MREIPSSRSSFQNLFIVFYCIESLHWLVKVEHVLGVVLSTLSPTELAAINLLISELDFPLIEQDQRVQVASRLITEDGITFYSTAYKRVRVRNSYTVHYSSGFGQICCFVALDGLSYVLVLTKLLQLAGTRLPLTSWPGIVSY